MSNVEAKHGQKSRPAVDVTKQFSIFKAGYYLA